MAPPFLLDTEPMIGLPRTGLHLLQDSRLTGLQVRRQPTQEVLRVALRVVLRVPPVGEVLRHLLVILLVASQIKMEPTVTMAMLLPWPLLPRQRSLPQTDLPFTQPSPLHPPSLPSPVLRLR